MSMIHFIEPLDLLFLRSNKSFGGPGSFGESLIPPWPSVVAGAIRSALLVHKGCDLARFAGGEVADPEIGTPERPGPFAVTAFHLARRHGDGRVEPLFSLPADLVVSTDPDHGQVVRRLRPTAMVDPIVSSYKLPHLPVLPEPTRSKPERGLWLTEAGWSEYLEGRTPSPDELVSQERLWTLDTRVGVALDPVRRRAADGRLFTVQGVSFASRAGRAPADVGFMVGVAGAALPPSLTLRLGGDGRAALSTEATVPWPEPDYDALVADGRCRIVLTSPAIFTKGWLLPGVTEGAQGEKRLSLHGVKGRLVAAAVPRAEVVSGWDLARGRPKAARRVAATGAVYWLDEVDATPDSLRSWLRHGLWSEPCEDPHRRCEGFNRFSLARWR